MKKYTVQAMVLYALGLALACFLNMDKLLPWYAQETMGEDSAILATLEDAQDVRNAVGITKAVDAFDCSTAFLFNDIYKDNTKCLDDLSNRSLRETWRSMSQSDRRKAAHRVWAMLQSASQGAIATTAGYSPASDNKLSVISTGAKDSQLEIGIEVAEDTTRETPQDATATATPAPKKELHSVLVVGDSLAIGLAKSFEQALKGYNDQIEFARVGKVSSGLAIPHLFDWEKKVQVLIDKHQPDLIIVMMGINDANNNIRVDDRKAILGTAAWPEAYQERVTRFLRIILDYDVPVYWVRLPVVRDEAMTGRIEIANDAAEKACNQFDQCHFIDTLNILTDDNGNYTNFKKDAQGYTIRIRAQDGIHFSSEGGDILSHYILEYISKHMQLRPAADTTAGSHAEPGVAVDADKSI